MDLFVHSNPTPMADNVKSSEKVNFVVLQMVDGAAPVATSFASAEKLAEWSQSLVAKPAPESRTFTQALRDEFISRSLEVVPSSPGDKFLKVFTTKYGYPLVFSLECRVDCVVVEFSCSDTTDPTCEKYKIPRSIKLVTNHVETVVGNFTMEKFIRRFIPNPIRIISKDHFSVEVDDRFCVLKIEYPACILTYGLNGDEESYQSDGFGNKTLAENLNAVKAKLHMLAHAWRKPHTKVEHYGEACGSPLCR